MSLAPPAERLAAARAEVERACDLLIAPNGDAWDRCRAALDQAASELAHCVPEMRQARGNAEVLSQARRLRRQVLRAGRLLESVADFYRGWERILGAMSAGYTSNGEAAPVARRARVCCQG